MTMTAWHRGAGGETLGKGEGGGTAASKSSFRVRPDLISRDLLKPSLRPCLVAVGPAPKHHAHQRGQTALGAVSAAGLGGGDGNKAHGSVRSVRETHSPGRADRQACSRARLFPGGVGAGGTCACPTSPHYPKPWPLPFLTPAPNDTIPLWSFPATKREQEQLGTRTALFLSPARTASCPAVLSLKGFIFVY